MKKILAIGIALAMLCTFAVSAADKVTVTHWYWADSPQYSATMQAMAADFTATNGKGITVVAQEYPWDGGGYSQTLFRAVMGGGGPDTSSFKLTSTPLFSANGLLANLDSYIATWKDKDQIEASLYNTMKGASGTKNVYVMPWNTQVLYLYYRPSMFKKVGISVPKTYAEFLDACKKLTQDTNGDGKTEVYGFGMRGAKGGQEPWGSFIYARGGSFEDMTSAQAVQGMQDYIDLFKKGYAPPTAPMDGFNEIIANFKSGKTAMTVHHIGSSAGMIDTFGDDVAVEGKKLAAGTYSLVTIPGKDEWTVIFNLDTALWYRTDYNAALDVLRVKVKPAAGELRESFEIGFQNVGADSATLVIAWEKVAVPVSLQVDTKGRTIARAREAVTKAKIDDWETPLAVARYYATEKVNLAEALALAEKSITIKKGYANVAWKARILALDGKSADAVKAGEEAVAIAKASPEKPSTESLEKQIAEWKAKK